jgi:hypothetical protein
MTGEWAGFSGPIPDLGRQTGGERAMQCARAMRVAACVKNAVAWLQQRCPRGTDWCVAPLEHRPAHLVQVEAPWLGRAWRRAARFPAGGGGIAVPPERSERTFMARQVS